MQMLPKAILASLFTVAAPFGLVGHQMLSGAAALEAVASQAVGTSSSTPTANPTPSSVATAAASVTAPAATSSDSAPRVVTIGDSIMAGYGLDDESQAWPAIAASTEGVDVTNLACSGAGFVRVGDCGLDFGGLVRQAAAAQPDLIVIQSTDNDVDQSPAAIVNATNRTVARLHAAVPDAQIVGLSTLWDQPGEGPAEVAQSSDALQAAVTAVGGTFVDVGQPLAGKPWLLQGDSEHPTVAGQRVLGAAIAADLAAIGIQH